MRGGLAARSPSRGICPPALRGANARQLSPLMPANAGIQSLALWVPAFAGTSGERRARPRSTDIASPTPKSTIMAPTLTSEAWTQIRYDYEHTERPIAAICAEHGISSGTLRDRMRRWGWTRRRPPIPREGPPPLAGAAGRDCGRLRAWRRRCRPRACSTWRRRRLWTKIHPTPPPRAGSCAGCELACGARRRPSPSRACARARASAARVGG